MPPLFTYNFQNSIVSSDGVQLASQALTQPGGAKLLLDQPLPMGAFTLDLAPMLAQISDPSVITIVAESGVQVKFDGGATFSAKCFKTITLQVVNNTPGPSGVLDLQLQVPASIVATQRLRVFCIGA